MNVQDLGRLSLGEWAATVRGWNSIHGNGSKSDAPSEGELEAAMLAARGAE
jgi:hypothetical protein